MQQNSTNKINLIIVEQPQTHKRRSQLLIGSNGF